MAVLSEATQTFEAILKNLDATEQQQIFDSLQQFQRSSETTAPGSLALRLGGRTFSQQERLKLELDSLFNYFRHRRTLLENSLTASEVANLLGTSRQTPHDRLKNKSLLGVLDRGAYRFPIWQFDAAGPDGVLEGLPEVLHALKLSDFVKLNWLVRPNPILNGLTPVDALKQGLKERVIQEAVGVGVF